MAFFDNGYPEEFLLFISNFNMALEVPVTLMDGAKVQYLCILVCGEVLRQFYTMSDKVGVTNPENLTSIFLGLNTYFFLFMLYLKKSTMRHRMRNLRSLKARHYTARLIGLNKYWPVFPCVKASESFYKTKLNEMF